jgi:predicted secreted protein
VIEVLLMFDLNRTVKLAAFIGLTCVGYAWCADPLQESGKHVVSSTTISIGDNGKTFKVKAGQSVIVQLPVQRGTGYSWRPTKDEQPLLLELKEQGDVSKSSSKPGSEEMQEFSFSSKIAVTTELVFEYRRPWDQNSSPAKFFRVKIESQK